MNGVCGTLSILLSARYLLQSSNLPRPLSEEATRTLYTAIILPMLGFGFDALDGKVARWMGGGSMLGQEMDSLADLISFGVAPATLAYVMGLRTPLDVICLLLFVSCGLARLARFNATVALIPADASGKSKYFEGIPIPSSLFLDAMMAYFVHSGHFAMGAHGDLPFGTIELLAGNKGSTVHVLSLIFAAWAAAMVSKTLRVSRAAVSMTDVRSPNCRRALVVQCQTASLGRRLVARACVTFYMRAGPTTSSPHRLGWPFVVKENISLNNSNNSALYTQLL